jgi:hypothetical protein
MTAQPWPLPSATADTPCLCAVCGEVVRHGDGAGIIAQPHLYHVACYIRLHTALWAKENQGKTIAAVRALVAEDVTKGRKG